MYEYQFIALNSPRTEDKTTALNAWTSQHWQVEQINQDFTMALLRRECEPTAWKVPTALGAKPTPDHIRDTDSFKVIQSVSSTFAIEVAHEPSFVRALDKDTSESEQRAREGL